MSLIENSIFSPLSKFSVLESIEIDVSFVLQYSINYEEGDVNDEEKAMLTR